jgi:DNA-binding transcriptional ArsR family regulator
MKTSAVPGLLKQINEREVLETIRAAAPISRAEISRRAGISKPTVSLALQSLLEAGLVQEAARPPDGPGYGAVYFEPLVEAAFALAFDLGARFVRGAICDLSGSIRARQDVELAMPDATAAVFAIARLQTALLASSGLDLALVDGVVVGVPGVIAGDVLQEALFCRFESFAAQMPFSDVASHVSGLPQDFGERDSLQRQFVSNHGSLQSLSRLIGTSRQPVSQVEALRILAREHCGTRGRADGTCSVGLSESHSF